MLYAYFRFSYLSLLVRVLATSHLYPLSLHDALPISPARYGTLILSTITSTPPNARTASGMPAGTRGRRSEEHTSELQSRGQIVCRLLLEKKKQSEMANK